MFRVFIESAGGYKEEVAQFDTEKEADDFCEAYNNCEDENGFIWDMFYEEAEN